MAQAYQIEGREKLRERFYRSKLVEADKHITALRSSTKTLAMLFPNFDNEQSHSRLFQNSEIETMATGIQLLQQISDRLDQLDDALDDISPSVATLQSKIHQCKRSLSQYEQDAGFNNYSTKFSIYCTIYVEINSLIAQIEMILNLPKSAAPKEKSLKRPREVLSESSEPRPVKYHKDVLAPLQQIYLSLSHEAQQLDFQYSNSTNPKTLSGEVWQNYYKEQASRLEGILERKHKVVQRAISELNGLLHDEPSPETSQQIQQILSTLDQPIQPRTDDPKTYYPSYVLPTLDLKHTLSETQNNLKEACKLLNRTTAMLLETDKQAELPMNGAN